MGKAQSIPDIPLHFQNKQTSLNCAYVAFLSKLSNISTMFKTVQDFKLTSLVDLSMSLTNSIKDASLMTAKDGATKSVSKFGKLVSSNAEQCFKNCMFQTNDHYTFITSLIVSSLEVILTKQNETHTITYTKHLSCRICPLELTIRSSASNPSWQTAQMALLIPRLGRDIPFNTGI